ncbi:hypothetical protein [Thermococcus stetteri]|uniref:hypothetical protein n=1 Tax=Thermococcus stetteri TaxID=49900 RepID=UPI001AEB006E|nr:hypothetical protein [Thermococcus stetteri]MBP1912132.1 hypothetical protein [Thermococcus stetteri]
MLLLHVLLRLLEGGHEECYDSNEKGEYIGTLEMTMDIAPYKEIEGEKRLLDWRE